MKKFILPMMLSVVLIMFLGCQSNMPVQPNNYSLLPLEKPSVIAGAYCYSDTLSVNWNSYGGASEYRISSLPPFGGNWTELTVVPVKHGQKSYIYLLDVSLWTGGFYMIKVEALNRRGDVKSNTEISVSISH